MSKIDAITILGHSGTYKGGESVQVKKFAHLLNGAVEQVVDIFDFFDGRYDSLASLNYALAESGQELLDEIGFSFPTIETKNVLVLSFSQTLAALMATGLQKKHRIISKFYVHHRNERVLPLLYDQTDLLITESLLANIRGAAYGIPESKMLYFPHHYPQEIEKLPPKKKSNKVTIGVVSRFERGKNCEYALEAVRRLAENLPVELILMGDFEAATTDPSYQAKFKEMLDCYSDAQWFHWEREVLPYPQVLEAYNRFDICLQLSGAEAGSNIIVELLGMGKPVIALKASTNPYLFKGGAYLVEAEPDDHQGQLFYQVPNIDALEAAVETLVREPKLRKEWGQKARDLARRRFHESIAKEKVSLLFESDPKKIQTCFDADRKEYGL